MDWDLWRRSQCFLGEYVVNYDLSNTLSNNLVTGFTEQENGDLWIGSYGGEFRYYPENMLISLHQAKFHKN